MQATTSAIRGEEMKKQKALMSQTMDLLSKNWIFVKCWSMMECEYCVDESNEKVDESGTRRMRRWMT